MKRPLPLIGAATVYAIGIVIRYLYIFVWHPAADYRYSFMTMYYTAAKNYRDAAYVPGIRDTLVPPGMGYFIGMTRWPNPLDPSQPNLMPAYAAQLLLSCLVPLVLGLIALELYDRRAALLTVAIASLYFPFIDYAGYFLAEGPFLFFLVLAFWLLVRSLRAQGWRGWGFLFALFAGLTLGIAAAFKSVALAAGLCVLAALLWLSHKRGLAVRRTILGGAAGLLLVLIPLSVRATRLNEGKFCLIANDWPRTFLLGHCGADDHGRRCSRINFEDTEHYFMSPAAFERSDDGAITVPFKAFESSKLLEKGLEDIRKAPVDSCLSSFQHIFDLTFNNLPWPSGAVADKDDPQERKDHLASLHPWVETFQKFFIVFLLFPACIYLYRNAGAHIKGNLPGELLVLMPPIAIMAAAFLFVGEARYRIPFDGFVILLAARQYCGRAEPAAATGADAAAGRVAYQNEASKMR